MSWGLTKEEEAERDKRLAKEEANFKKREEQLLTELLGETVKIRNRGYKTMKTAVVDARPHTEWKDGELVENGYAVRFNWKDEGRSGQVRAIRRLDVMTERGWATVWDDGMDDLSEWERNRPATSAAPTGLKYRSGMLH